MRRAFVSAYFLVAGFMCALASTALPAAAAEHCAVRIESVDEDRTLFNARPMWNASLFTVTLIARDTLPRDAALRVYTLGGEYRTNAHALQWFPTDSASIYRSAPVELAFPEDVTFLHVGITGMTDRAGYHDCVPRLFGAFAAAPRLSLAPLRRETGLTMEPAQRRQKPGNNPHCLTQPVRITKRVPFDMAVPGRAPSTGGPYISLAAVTVTKTGKIEKDTIEISSGLAWLDAQTQESAKQQGYTSGFSDCKAVPGVYYYAGRYDTPGEDDVTRLF